MTARAADVVGDIDVRAAVGLEPEPLAAAAGVGVALEPLVLEDAVSGVAAGVAPRRLRALEPSCHAVCACAAAAASSTASSSGGDGRSAAERHAMCGLSMAGATQSECVEPSRHPWDVAPAILLQPSAYVAKSPQRPAGKPLRRKWCLYQDLRIASRSNVAVCHRAAGG